MSGLSGVFRRHMTGSVMKLMSAAAMERLNESHEYAWIGQIFSFVSPAIVSTSTLFIKLEGD